MIEIWTDGSNTEKGTSTRGAWVIKKDGVLINQGTIGGYPGWSDVGEYLGVYGGILALEKLGLQNENITWYCDSDFVVKQLQGRYRIKKANHTLLACVSLSRLGRFPFVTYQWIPREQNKEADALCTFREKK